MSEFLAKPCTAFDGHRLIAAGPLLEVALAVKAAIEGEAAGPVLTFDDGTGAVVDLDLRGSKAEIVTRLAEQGEHVPPRSMRRPLPPADEQSGLSPPRGRGRPTLGVVAREVTLLPRHWEWLAAQQGGASVTLRRLVDEARRSDGGHSRVRAVRETTYRFMSAMAGDLPGFEEAARALFAGDNDRFQQQTAAWPADVRAYTHRLAQGAETGSDETTRGM